MLNQFLLAASAVLAAYLSQSSDQETRRYACLVGLIGAPFWLIESYSAGQWGVFISSLFFTAVWAKGIWCFWVKKAPC